MMARSVAFVAAALLTAVATTAMAADPYPSRQVNVVVPFPPGGGADILARLIGERLSETWKQPIVVENKSGAAGVMGANGVARSEPDGYTLLLAASGAVVASNIKDLAPVTLMTAPPYLLVVHASVPVSSTKEFVDYLKARPGEVNFASSGAGSASHLSAELFMAMSGTKMTHVPYKGIGQAVNDLLGNNVSVMFGPPPAVLPHVKSGALKAIAVTSKERSPLFKDIPTISESGVPNYEAVGWYGLLAPAKTPKDVVAKIAEDVGRAMKVPLIEERLATMGAIPAPSTPEEFSRFIEADTAKWDDLLKKARTTP